MTRRMRTVGAVLLAAGLLVAGHGEPASAEPKRTFTADEVGFYEKQVLPILKDACFKCHSGKKVRGGLRLDSRAAVLKGGDLGPSVLPDRLDASPLVKAIHFRDNLEMPPDGKLPAEKIDVLMRWLRMGMPYPPEKEPVAQAPTHQPGAISAEDRAWWAYRPLRRPAVPPVRDHGWARTPVDTFILAKLEAAGLTPNPPADRVALVRRVTYDLTGLPPTPEEVDAFVADARPDAYERLVDRLLASPAYGEKWGRHWLDLVRFAETNGYERDGIKPYAWRYRDYVIRSLNADKPYDRFVREQLAGDELPGDDADAVIATGYYRLGLWDDEPPDPKQSRADEMDDWVTTTGQVFLGMSLNCARCHEHKKDPIPQADYYRFVAFFQDVRHFSGSRDPRSASNLTDITPVSERSTYEDELKQREIRKADLTAAMERIENEAIKRMPAEDQRAAEGVDRPQVVLKLKKVFTDDEAKAYRQLKGERTRLERLPNPAQQLALSVNNCLVRPPTTHVLVRGSPHAPGAKVEPGFPSVFGVPDPVVPPPAKTARSSGRRTALAEWITARANPLPARVLANRLWQYHFGRGIVGSSSDFGKLGELPSHPDLLDGLASELHAGDWAAPGACTGCWSPPASTGSRRSRRPPGWRRMPANNHYWRYPMRRLTAEEVRDSMLAVSGALQRRMAGEGVYPTIPAAVLAGQSVPGAGWGKSPPAEQARRSVYVHVKRSLVVPILQSHDQADTDNSCAVRYTTTVPTQALGMLNGEFTHEQAAALAERIGREAPDDLSAQVRRAVRLTTGRPPRADEVRHDVAFVEATQAENRLDRPAALRMYCLLLLNANEFVYLD
ncbi:MAG: PSD1 and planctomycete cytochrome C domain-containing protein [Gemmataceae bacterium]